MSRVNFNFYLRNKHKPPAAYHIVYSILHIIVLVEHVICCKGGYDVNMLHYHNNAKKADCLPLLLQLITFLESTSRIGLQSLSRGATRAYVRVQQVVFTFSIFRVRLTWTSGCFRRIRLTLLRWETFARQIYPETFFCPPCCTALWVGWLLRVLSLMNLFCLIKIWRVSRYYS